MSMAMALSGTASVLLCILDVFGSNLDCRHYRAYPEVLFAFRQFTQPRVTISFYQGTAQSAVPSLSRTTWARKSVLALTTAKVKPAQDEVDEGINP
jgi:hypothetical protein